MPGASWPPGRGRLGCLVLRELGHRHDRRGPDSINYLDLEDPIDLARFPRAALARSDADAASWLQSYLRTRPHPTSASSVFRCRPRRSNASLPPSRTIRRTCGTRPPSGAPSTSVTWTRFSGGHRVRAIPRFPGVDDPDPILLQLHVLQRRLHRRRRSRSIGTKHASGL